jgi:hypothetical protein
VTLSAQVVEPALLIRGIGEVHDLGMHGWIVLVAQPRFSIASISEMLGDRFLETGHQHRPRAITALRLHLRQGGITRVRTRSATSET